MPKRLPRRSLLLAAGAGLLASCGEPAFVGQDDHLRHEAFINPSRIS